MSQTLYIVIIGCGRLGGTLASRLSGYGHNVVVVDRDETAFNLLTSEFSGFQVLGDASELAVLKHANCDQANCLLAVTGEDNLNLMVAQIALRVFNISKVLARVQDLIRQNIFQDFCKRYGLIQRSYRHEDCVGRRWEASLFFSQAVRALGSRSDRGYSKCR